VTEPIFWLVCSFLLVAVCLTAVLMAAIPALRELARASRSAEKLFDTLHRELPPTLEAIRLTGADISDLTDDLGGGVESAGNVVKQIDQSLRVAQHQAKEAAITTQSVWAGVQAAWKSFKKTSQKRKRRQPTQPLASKSERRGSTGDSSAPRIRPAPNNRPTATFQQKSPVDYPESPSTSVKPSGRSRAEQRHDASSLDGSSPSEKHIEPLPENPSSSEPE
jgi:hypothetical protein